MNRQPLLSHAKCAEILGISETALYALVNRREIAVHKSGRKSFYSVDDIIDYQTKIRIPATA